jgi:hypothetical protein
VESERKERRRIEGRRRSFEPGKNELVDSDTIAGAPATRRPGAALLLACVACSCKLGVNARARFSRTRSIII